MSQSKKFSRPPSARLVTIKEYSELVGVPGSTLRLMAREGRLPGAIMPGTEWLVDTNAKLPTFQGRGRPWPKKGRKGNDLPSSKQ
jgi:excisionase family DNA binding protein